jgi:hypothetical protein
MAGSNPENGDAVGHTDASAVEPEMSPGKYLATRATTLKPPMTKAPNPFKLLALLNKQQWLFFLVRQSISSKQPISVITETQETDTNKRFIGFLPRMVLGRL